LEWYAHVPHDPSYFRVWVTKAGYDPLSELAWDDLEELEVGDVHRDLPYYRFQVDLPERTGRHIIYVAWQRIDPVGEVFFAACDVIFDAEPGTNPTEDDIDHGDGLVEPVSVDFRLDSAWGNDFNGSIVITNPSANAPVHGWEVSWQGSPNLSTSWNGDFDSDGQTTTVSWADWNQDINPGESVTVGFSGTGTWPPAPENVLLLGQQANVYIDGELYYEVEEPEPHACAGDFNHDHVVDTQDFSVFLLHFGSSNAMTDLNEDGTTDIQDFSLFLLAFGSSCMH